MPNSAVGQNVQVNFAVSPALLTMMWGGKFMSIFSPIGNLFFLIKQNFLRENQLSLNIFLNIKMPQNLRTNCFNLEKHFFFQPKAFEKNPNPLKLIKMLAEVFQVLVL
ncbi:hypothetical protein KIL84_022213 [Mauremys mutica]|uniref:Uncharacterized protein n=1 Tax=Mauremys mutica TaxID=74926 RepID=A0A9D3XA87_9SAUR|nr:hypothetical protein KIL84_022213 [Mauremys mutica]